MNWLGLFKGGGDTIKGTLEGVGELSKDIRTAITGEMNPEDKADIEVKLITLQSEVLKIQSSVITAEANGQSWLQRNWRSITMITFLILVVFNSFGLLVTPLAPEAWDLLKIGLGGYVIGRSAEKVVNTINN